MPLIRPSKLPPPPELGEKTFWDYFPKKSMRRVFFMLLALAAVLFLRSSGGGSFGGLFEPVRPKPQPQSEPYYRLDVKPSPPKSTP
jgi:hypothetical protein